MAGLRKESIQGFFWMSLGKIGTGFTSLLVTMILARLLVPEDFAIIELLIIFIAISNIFIDSGFSQAIIRDDDPSQKDLSSVFYFNLFISLIVYLILYIGAPYLADFFHSSKLILLSRFAFLVIIFNSLIIIQNAKLVREFKFKIVSKCAVIGMVGAGLISVTLAVLGFGVWAIAANIVMQPLLKACSLWIFSNWRPSIYFSFKVIKKYLSFSFFLLLQGLMDSIITNINSLIIGKIYTKQDLGFYSQGRKLDGYIVSPFVMVLEQVTYSITSKIKNEDERLRLSYKQIFKIILFVFMPVSFFVILNGDLIVSVLFGDKWISAGIYLSISSIFDLFFPIQKLCTNIIMVKGETKKMFYFAIVKQFTRLIVVIALAKTSVLALALGFTLSGIFGGLLYIILGFKLINYTFLEFFKDQTKTIVASSLSLLLTFVFLYCSSYNKYISVTLSTIIMIFSYFIFSTILRNDSLLAIKNIILNKIK